MVSIIFFFIAACLNALMDMTAQMWESSVMARKPKVFNPRWWNLFESYKYARRILGTSVDAWHVSKFFMILFIIVSIFSYSSSFFVILLYPFIWCIGFETSKYFLTFKINK